MNYINICSFPKVDIKTRNIPRDKEGYFITIKRSAKPEAILIINNM